MMGFPQFLMWSLHMFSFTVVLLVVHIAASELLTMKKENSLGLRMAVSHVLDAHSPFRPAGCDDICAAQMLATGNLTRYPTKKRRRLSSDFPYGVVTSYFTRKGASPEYYVEISAGSEGHPLFMMLDTDSDLSWIQCKPCNPCHNQELPVFVPTESSSYKPQVKGDNFCAAVEAEGDGDGSSSNSCRYKIEYEDHDRTLGDVALETFVFLDRNSPSSNLEYELGFGCGTSNHFKIYTPTSGILGLGFGTNISWPEQLRDHYGFNPAFSFCFAPIFSPPQKGWIAWGAAAIPSSDGSYFTTAIAKGVEVGPHYVLVHDMRVNGVNVGIPKGVLDGRRGVQVDTGSSLTNMVREAYKPLRKAYIKAMRPVVGAPDGNQGPLGLTTCWPYPEGIGLPKVAFQFKDGSEFEIHSTSTMFVYYSRRGNRRMCMPYYVFMPDNDHDYCSMLIGGFSLHGHQIVFDTRARLFGWKYNVCSS